MPIVLDDVILPDCVARFDAEGTQMRKNDRAENQGGYVTTNVVWQNTLRRYNFGIVPMSLEAWSAIEAIYEITDAGAYGFLMDDPKDMASDGFGLQPVILQSGRYVNVGSLGDGYGVPTYQITRVYEVQGTSRVKVRRITRPYDFVIRRGGSPATVGDELGQIAVGQASGIVTFTPDDQAVVNSITVGSTTSVVLADTLVGLVIGDRLWLEGLSGADAVAMNGKSHEIANLVGSTYTLDTNTTALDITASGLGKKYPQARETLDWSGKFRVPVFFTNDELDWQIVRSGDYENRLVAGPSVTLMEVRE